MTDQGNREREREKDDENVSERSRETVQGWGDVWGSLGRHKLLNPYTIPPLLSQGLL